MIPLASRRHSLVVRYGIDDDDCWCLMISVFLPYGNYKISNNDEDDRLLLNCPYRSVMVMMMMMVGGWVGVCVCVCAFMCV